MWAAALAAAASPASALASGPAGRCSPNEMLRAAVVGVKGRGSSHVADLCKLKDVDVVAIVDIDENVVDGVMKTAEKKSGKKPEFYKDIRKMLENKDIDIVSIATTNHTHSLFSIWSMQAGKHVYVEKPVSHNVFEGRKVVEAARKYKRICQHGTQSRSSRGLKEAMKFLHGGGLGKVQIARGLCYKGRGSIGTQADSQAPAGVDYDLWLGPAPVRPFNRNRFHYNWHWFWDYGNGDVGNQGVHEMDRARWGLGKDTLPTKVATVGGRLGYEDMAETPNTMVTWMDYGDQQLIFEVRGLKTDKYKEAGIGVIFHCENGYMVNPSYSAATAFDKDGKKLQSYDGGGDHFGNLVAAIKSGKPSDLNAEIEEGHLSAALCHLANCSYRLGEKKPMDKAEPFPKNEAGTESFERMKKHLADNGVKADAPVQVGPLLTFDPKAEKFTGNEAANKLLTREYRKPFVVPDSV
jgi:predicted dehydrogenase